MEQLDKVYGSHIKSIPQHSMVNTDLACIIDSNEVQIILNTYKRNGGRHLRKKNTIKSLKALQVIDP